MHTIVFQNGTILHIEDIALEELFHYTQRGINSREAGGVLIGKKLSSKDEYIICGLTTPNVYDKRDYLSFTRSVKLHQSYINKRWKETNGIENYVGEWHTHPEVMPTPSTIDRDLIKQVVRDHTGVFGKIFLIIVGQKRTMYIGCAEIINGGEICAYVKRVFE